jgi:hypothetical protein
VKRNPGQALRLSPGFRFAQCGLFAENDPADIGTLTPHPEVAAQRPSKDALSKDEAERGMAQMSQKFLDLGAEVYVDKTEAAKEANKAL